MELLSVGFSGVVDLLLFAGGGKCVGGVCNLQGMSGEMVEEAPGRILSLDCRCLL
jgi:hypothetical protein